MARFLPSIHLPVFVSWILSGAGDSWESMRCCAAFMVKAKSLDARELDVSGSFFES